MLTKPQIADLNAAGFPTNEGGILKIQQPKINRVDDAKNKISILHDELLTGRCIDGGTISARSHACHELVVLRRIFDILDGEL